MRRRRFILPLLALALLAPACGGDDGDDGDAAASPEPADTTETTETTEAPAPGNPEGDWFVLRWMVDSDNPPPNFQTGLATSRVWELTPTCEGDDPCDLTLSGGGEGGSYDPEGFEASGEPPPDVTLTHDQEADAWILEEEIGPYANCRTEDGTYLEGDFTTMDLTEEVEFAWSEDGTRLEGVRTETFTLNDAGRAEPACSPDSDETLTYSIVMVPMEAYEAAVEAEVELAEEYAHTQEVYAVEGTTTVDVFDWTLNQAPVTGSGSCGPDDCDGDLTFELTEGTDPAELALALDGGALTASYRGVGACFSGASIEAGEPEVLTEEGYEVAWDLDVVPITINDDGDQALVARGDVVNEPLADAAGEFADDCATTEVIGAYQYLIPSEAASG